MEFSAVRKKKERACNIRKVLYNGSMKNRKELLTRRWFQLLEAYAFRYPQGVVVMRYHSKPVAFDTLAQAEDFAQGCGDFAELKEIFSEKVLAPLSN